MGIFQEAAVWVGDNWTRPLWKLTAEKYTGHKFKVVRDKKVEYSLDAVRKGGVYKVTWDLEVIGRKKQETPTYKY